MNSGRDHGRSEAGFGEHNWTDMHSYDGGNAHSSPSHEYQGFQFASPQIMPLEPAYNMSIPPPYTSHQQLQPLIMPQWPSMLTSPSNYSTPITSATTSTPISATSASSNQSNPIPTPTTANSTGSTPRRTLTDADRRAMCIYHRENPTVKQTEIGAMFGVERSTVSKVLRLKEKFLNQDDGDKSPVKKSKTKFPDIDRALLVWIQNQQKYGKPIDDRAIKERARQFALSVGSEDLQKKVKTDGWLIKFKFKNNVGITKPTGGTTSGPEPVTTGDSSSSSSHTPNCISPLSPKSGIASPPMSPGDVEQVPKMESNESFFDFEERDRTEHGSFTDVLPLLSAGVTSPTSPFWPESSAPEAFSPTNTSMKSEMPGGAPALRPRSQTFPNLNLEAGALLTSSQGEEITPKSLDRMVFDVFDSPVDDSSTSGSLSVNPMATMKRNNSVPNVRAERLIAMHPPPVPPLPKYEDHRPKSSPTQDDARRALELVMTFFENQPGISVDPQDFVTIGKLMEKLKLAGSPSSSTLPGGFHRVNLDEHESPRMKKKRSIRSL